jgi:hypothetical protein
MDKAAIITTISSYKGNPQKNPILEKFQQAAAKELEKGRKL